MATYLQVEKALINLGYDVDFNPRYRTKLIGYIPIDGYESEILEPLQTHSHQLDIFLLMAMSLKWF